MNFALMISCKVEEKLSQLERPDDWTQSDENRAYEESLQEVLQEDKRAWAEGNIRIGDYIILSKSMRTSLPANADFSS